MDFTIVGGSLYLCCGVAIFLLGLLVYHADPDVRLHRVAALMLLFGGLGPTLAGVGIFLGWSGPGGPEAQPNLVTGFAYVWELFFPSLLWFALIFPREAAILKRMPRLPLLLYAPHAFHLVLLIVLGLIGAPDWGSEVRWLPGGEGLVGTVASTVLRLAGLLFELLTRIHLRFFSFINVVYAASAVALLGWRWRSLRSPKLKRQLGLLLFGLGGCVSLYALAVPVPAVVARNWPPQVRVVLVSVALLLGTGSIAFGIVRRSFLDVGTVMRRAIVLSAISGGLVVLYFLTARSMDRIVLAQTGRDLPIFRTIFVILVVVFFHPILTRVEATVDRMVHGNPEGHAGLVRRLGRDMTAILDLATLTSTLVDTLREALVLESAHLVLLDPERGRYVSRTSGAATIEFEPGDPLVSRVAGLGDPKLAGDLADEAESEAERAAIRRALGALGARLVVPIQLPEGGGCIGFLVLGPKLTGSRFNAEDLTLLSILSTQAGIAIRNARLHEESVARRIVDQELTMARAIQEAILTAHRASPGQADLAALSVPSRQVGGDYFDLIPLSSNRLGVAIGDVSGKGIPAALLMSMLHAGLHAQVNGSAAVAEVASRMNRILYRSTSYEKFATFFFGIYDPALHTFRYTNAGHNSPLLLHPDGSVDRLREGGLILGVLEEASYREAAVAVRAGDLLVFYTDGVTEAAAGDIEYGEGRLIDVVRACTRLRAQDIVHRVREDVAAFSGHAAFADDFTLIVFRAY